MGDPIPALIVSQRLGFAVRNLDHSRIGADSIRCHARPSACFSQYPMAVVADAYLVAPQALSSRRMCRR
jgi:hypothetical protein